jgi:hypothetical protein
MGKKRLKQRAENVYWMRSCLLTSADVIEFRTTDASSNSDLSDVKYNRYSHSKEKKGKGMQRTRPSNLILRENI